jgi:hypothetical protein
MGLSLQKNFFFKYLWLSVSCHVAKIERNGVLRVGEQKRGFFIWTYNILKKHGVRVWTELFGVVQGSLPVSCTEFQVQRENIQGYSK